MSSKFKKRLKQLHGSREKRRRQSTQDEQSRVFTADDVEEQDLGIATSAVDAWRDHGADSRPTARGEAHFLVRHHPQSHQHGTKRLAEGAAVTLEGFRKQLNDARLHSADPSRLVFLDLETNGLSKTSFPFCIGIGVWEGSQFGVYHYFTPTEADEPASLSACAEILRDCEGLCTFNGSSFDVRMLQRRFSHYGIEHPLDDLAHLDLLHLARKLLPDRNGHKLSQLEEDVLGFGRTDDVPGAKIPGRWKQYLKTGSPHLLLDVFDHNRLDILSMVVLLPALAEGLGSSSDSARFKNRASKSDLGNRPSSSGSDQQARPPKAKPKTKLASQLSRTYALRKKAQSGGRRQPETRPTEQARQEDVPRETVKLAGSFSRAKLRRGMPIGTRLRELRGEVERLEREGRGDEERDEIVHRLHEMVALSPRNPFALERLVDYYRGTGDAALADHFAKRLDETSPF
ncbi:hypothetical protein FIV42_12965 [Persicimonas caeni]|uniref:YprB ribonuclease H-like domain-containing protein n=1 Tax=Persicimonas caeni TaxID=2292766 RepID=A0A4Y6PV52_PERCE|nr:ribonuclease H-like domain-containing protein [Persicimonas caeni]QDG51625.1 hypothetical protein FIV42_12965 [Persicimonas caeni]QED32846.1 hypothetical protein FRD00_12960 [Persicimonas caeni]